jgi:hypothetical protein
MPMFLQKRVCIVATLAFMSNFMHVSQKWHNNCQRKVWGILCHWNVSLE